MKPDGSVGVIGAAAHVMAVVVVVDKAWVLSIGLDGCMLATGTGPAATDGWV